MWGGTQHRGIVTTHPVFIKCTVGSWRHHVSMMEFRRGHHMLQCTLLIKLYHLPEWNNVKSKACILPDTLRHQPHKHVHRIFRTQSSLFSCWSSVVISSRHHPHCCTDLNHFLPVNYLCLDVWEKEDTLQLVELVRKIPHVLQCSMFVIIKQSYTMTKDNATRKEIRATRTWGGGHKWLGSLWGTRWGKTALIIGCPGHLSRESLIKVEVLKVLIQSV